MIKVEFYAETAAEIRKQMLELLNLEANQTVSISISPEATVTEVKEAVKAAETKAKAQPAKAKVTPIATPAAAIQPEAPEAPPWVDPNAVEALEDPRGQQAEIEPPPTASQVREVLGEVSEKCGRDALTKLLAKFNVKQFSKLEPTQYAEAMAAARGLLK